MGFERPWQRGMAPVMQAEAAECGLACVAMIAVHHGHRVNLAGLRQLYPTSMKGMTLAALMAIASDLELAPRAVRLEVEELHQLALPAILHWDLNHFVVLERVRGAAATVLDPAGGRRIVPVAKLGRHFTGVALELAPTPAFKPVEARVTIRLSDLWSRLVNYRSALTQLLTLSLLLQVATLAMPFYMQLTIDEAIAQGDLSLMALLFIGFAAVYALNAVLKALRSWVVLTLGQSISFQLGGNVVRHLFRLPLGYFEHRNVGDLLSRIGSIQPIQSLLSQGVVNAAIDGVLALTTLIIMTIISPALAAAVVVTTCAYIGVGLFMYPALRRRTAEQITARAVEETYLLESIRGIRSIKMHANEPMRESGWRNRYADVVSAGYRARRYGIQLSLAEDLLFGLQFLLVVYIGARGVIGGAFSLGVLLAFLSYRSSFTASATALVEQAQQWRLINIHLERLSDIVRQESESLLAPPPRPGIAAPPWISAEGLGFSYGTGDAAVFSDLSLDIPRGSFVAIVGPSGSGKTTLLRILLGLLQPQSGQILVDGLPLTPARLGIWRSRIGAVLQDDQLLTGTLADNIAFFEERIDQQRVERAARRASIHDEIIAMPMAYQSLIGDMGAALSSGQRQRIMLARALYRDPDILFLDEGTANLDSVNETRIAEMIAALPITRVVIAHRPALIEQADFVFEMHEGRLIHVGDGAAAAARI
jgi:ATP-binding cassette subfamily B protein RaxB